MKQKKRVTWDKLDERKFLFLVRFLDIHTFQSFSF